MHTMIFLRGLNPASSQDIQHGEYLTGILIYATNNSRKVALTEPIEGKDFFNYSPAAEWKGMGFACRCRY